MLPPSVTHGGCGVALKVDEENVVKFDAWMMPENIKFSQASISSAFTRRPFQPGNNGENRRGMLYVERLKGSPILTIRDTLKQLESGELKVEQIPPIRVCQHRAEWFSLDNRRLWVFKQYGRLVPVIIAEVSKEFFQKSDSGTLNGKTVVILEANGMAQKQKQKDLTFSNTVLKWSTENIMSKNMYINKVRHIPLRFSDLKGYVEALKWPLLEDTRAKLQQSLESIAFKPYVPLQLIVETTKDDTMTQFKTFALRIGGRGSVVQRSKSDGPWTPLRLDLVLLTTFLPESLDDFGRSGEHCSVAQILSSDDKGGTPQNDLPFVIKAKAFMHDESPEYRAICHENFKTDWYLIFLESLVPGTRIWEALADLASEDASRKFAKEILLSKSVQLKDSTLECVAQKDEIVLEEAVKRFCNSRDLNSSQSQAVTTEFTSLTRGSGRRVSLIQGPPGTGKTKTTTTIVSIAACLKNRVLVSAPTNRAISEVAARCLLLLEDSSSNTSFYDFIQTTTSLEKIELSRNLRLGDVLMVGNKKKLDIDGILERIFLSRRVKRLRGALSPCSGWNPTRTKILDFLRTGLQKFQFREGGNQRTEAVDFVQFTKKVLNGVGKDLIASGQTLCNDLPSKLLGRRWIQRFADKLLSPAQRQTIRDSCDLTQRLLEAVAKDNLLAKDVLQCFDEDGRKCALQGHGSSEASRFCSARRELLEVLSRAPVCEVQVTRGNLEDFCLENAGLVFCTTCSAGSRRVKQSGSFNYAIVDEAAQLVEAETAIVMRLPDLERLLLVGDPRQLQAVVISQIAKDCGYGRSLFERLQASGYPCHMLEEQYRMHPDISCFPNHQFYRGAVLDGAVVKSDKYQKPYQGFYGAYGFIDVANGEEERTGTSRSWKNPVEAEVVQHLLLKIRATEKNQHVEIGVITPYQGQVEFLQKRLLGCGASHQPKNVDVTVKTVDGFQGGERDVVIFSAVRANSQGNIGFVEEARRLNVAMTRGRYCVWIVGHALTLGMKSELWMALIEDARERGCFFNGADDPEIRELIIRAKSEKEEIDGLMHHDAVPSQEIICQDKLHDGQDGRCIELSTTLTGDHHVGLQIIKCKNEQDKQVAVDVIDSAQASTKVKSLVEIEKVVVVGRSNQNEEFSKKQVKGEKGDRGAKVKSHVEVGKGMEHVGCTSQESNSTGKQVKGKKKEGIWAKVASQVQVGKVAEVVSCTSQENNTAGKQVKGKKKEGIGAKVESHVQVGKAAEVVSCTSQKNNSAGEQVQGKKKKGIGAKVTPRVEVGKGAEVISGTSQGNNSAGKQVQGKKEGIGVNVTPRVEVGKGVEVVGCISQKSNSVGKQVKGKKEAIWAKVMSDVDVGKEAEIVSCTSQNSNSEGKQAKGKKKQRIGAKVMSHVEAGKGAEIVNCTSLGNKSAGKQGKGKGKGDIAAKVTPVVEIDKTVKFEGCTSKENNSAGKQVKRKKKEGTAAKVKPVVKIDKKVKIGGCTSHKKKSTICQIKGKKKVDTAAKVKPVVKIDKKVKIGGCTSQKTNPAICQIKGKKKRNTCTKVASVVKTDERAEVVSGTSQRAESPRKQVKGKEEENVRFSLLKIDKGAEVKGCTSQETKSARNQVKGKKGADTGANVTSVVKIDEGVVGCTKSSRKQSKKKKKIEGIGTMVTSFMKVDREAEVVGCASQETNPSKKKGKGRKKEVRGTELTSLVEIVKGGTVLDSASQVKKFTENQRQWKKKDKK